MWRSFIQMHRHSIFLVTLVLIGSTAFFLIFVRYSLWKQKGGEKQTVATYAGFTFQYPNEWTVTEVPSQDINPALMQWLQVAVAERTATPVPHAIEVMVYALPQKAVQDIITSIESKYLSHEIQTPQGHKGIMLISENVSTYYYLFSYDSRTLLLATSSKFTETAEATDDIIRSLKF